MTRATTPPPPPPSAFPIPAPASAPNLNPSRLSIWGWLPFTLFFVLSVVGHGVCSVDWFTAIPGNFGDPRLNSVFLEHVYGWVMGRYPSLWSPQFFYPFENVLAFSDNHLGSVPIYMLLRLLDFSREGAMAGWIVAGCALNFIASYWVLRKLSFSGFAAAAGAFVFSSAMPVLGEPDHAQLVYRFATPLCFYYFWLAIQKGEPAKLGIAALWLAEQFYCSIYLGVFLSYLLLATFIASLLINPKGFFPFLWRSWQSYWQTESILKKGLAIGGVIIGVGLIVALLWKYKLVAKDYGYSWSRAEILSLLPRPGSYLVADQSPISSFLGKTAQGISWRHPHQLFIGFGIACFFCAGLLITGFAVLRHKIAQDARIKLAWVVSLALLLLVITTLSINDHSVYQYLLKLPGVNGLRVVSRIILVELLPVAILVAIACTALERVLAKSSRTLQLSIFLISALLISTETLTLEIPKKTFTQWRERITTQRTLLPEPLAVNSVLYISQKLNEWDYLTGIDAMILAQELGVPTLNGFSGQSPPGKVYSEPDRCTTAQDRLTAYTQFRGLDPKSTDQTASALLLLNTDQLRPKTPFAMASIAPGQAIDFSNRILDKDRPVELICGWSAPLPWGLWSTRAIAKIAIPLPQGTDPLPTKLILLLRAFGNANHPTQRVIIGIDGFTQEAVRLNAAPDHINTIELTIPTAARKDKYLLLDFQLPDRISPKALGIDANAQELGIGLTAIHYR